MPKKLNFIQRAKVAMTGSVKAFIPPLPTDNGWVDGVPLANYQTKPEQLRANLGWVYAANSAIVDDVASVELKLYQKQRNGDRKEIKEHEILELLENPMLAHDGEMMRSLFHTYRNLVGEAYLLMVKNGKPFEVKKGVLPDALQTLPAHLVDFKLGKQRYSDSVIRYSQNEYSVDEVIRNFMPDPGSPYQGRSIISAAAASIDTDEQMQSWNRRMFMNNARPGMVFNLQAEGGVDAEVYERLKSQVDELYTNDGVFRSLVIENGEVKPYMLTQHDLDFLASREFTRDEILAFFKVPSSILGMSKDYNRANIDGSRYIHYITNVVPRLRVECRMWNNALVRKYDPTLELDFENPVPEDKEAKLKEAAEGVNKWLTPDEAREAYGLPPLPDNLGSQLYVPINSIPLASIANSDKPAPAKPTGSAEDVVDEDDGEDEAAPEGKKSLLKPKTPAAKT